MKDGGKGRSGNSHVLDSPMRFASNNRSENFCRVRRSKSLAHDSGESCIGRKTKGMSKVARFLLPPEVFRHFAFLQERMERGAYGTYSEK